MVASLAPDTLLQLPHGGDCHAAAAIANCAPDEILDFSASLNPLGPPASVLQAVASTPAAIAAYPDPDSTQLRQALAEHYRLNPEWILAGNGAAELFTWIARDCAGIGETGLPVPAFGDYVRALRTANASHTNLTMLDAAGQLAPASVLKRLQERRQLLPVLFLNNPHNPTGHVWKRAELLEILPRFQLVVVDEAFMDFLPGDGASLLGDIYQWPQLVIVRSLTKFFAIAGLRVGFAVSHPDRLARWRQWRDPWSVNGLATVGAVAALNDYQFQHQTRAWLPAARQDLLAGFACLPGCDPYPSAANFLLIHTEVSVAALQHELLVRDRILIRNCYSFARDGSLGNDGDRYFRVAVRTPAENTRLLQSCARLLPELEHEASFQS
ncbi:MAG: threonine-phosphate decarboxylase CobD [Cyanobacteria bacterium J06642_2]